MSGSKERRRWTLPALITLVVFLIANVIVYGLVPKSVCPSGCVPKQRASTYPVYVVVNQAVDESSERMSSVLLDIRQFLTMIEKRLKNAPEVIYVDRGGGKVCHMRRVVRICGFPVAEHRLLPQKSNNSPTERALNERAWASFKHARKEISRWAASGDLTQLLLIGRADRHRFRNEEYGSNRGLAQARAKWVRDKLIRENQDAGVADNLASRTVVLSAGPLHVPAECKSEDACDDAYQRWRDRSVDIFACLTGPESLESYPGDALNDLDMCGPPWS